MRKVQRKLTIIRESGYLITCQNKQPILARKAINANFSVRENGTCFGAECYSLYKSKTNAKAQHMQPYAYLKFVNIQFIQLKKQIEPAQTGKQFFLYFYILKLQSHI